jgi:hypothetical protein
MRRAEAFARKSDVFRREAESDANLSSAQETPEIPV